MIKRELNPEQGKRLRECLKDKRMSQKELSEKSGYTPQHINNIIGGSRNMSQESAEVFANILDARKEYLLCMDDFKSYDSISQFLCDKINREVAAGKSLMAECGIELMESVIVDENLNIMYISENPSLFLEENEVIENATVNNNQPKIENGHVFIRLKMKEQIQMLPYAIVRNLFDDITDYAEFKCERFIKKHISPN